MTARRTLHGRFFLSALLIVLVCLAVCLTACTTPELSSEFDQAVVEASALNVIELVNSHASDDLRSMSTPEMQAALTDSVFEEIYATIDEAGAFKDVTEMAFVGSEDDDVVYAVAVAVAEYENETFTYTISFTTDMELAGLYYR